MTAQSARRLAERVHRGALDRYGSPLLEHVRRVAALVPREARTVAWLHEVLECSSMSAEELRGAGATDEELEAIALLTRNPELDAAAYEEHVARIAEAPGRAGELARIVKIADLRDRLSEIERPGRGSAARPPYRRALTLLRATPV